MVSGVPMLSLQRILLTKIEPNIAQTDVLIIMHLWGSEVFLAQRLSLRRVNHHLLDENLLMQAKTLDLFADSPNY